MGKVWFKDIKLAYNYGINKYGYEMPVEESSDDDQYNDKGPGFTGESQNVLWCWW